MPIARFQMPDGRVARFEVPAGTTPEQAQTMMAAHFSGQTKQPKAAPVEAKQSPEQKILADYQAGLASDKQTRRNVIGGLVRGAGSIGSNILRIGDYIDEKINGRDLSQLVKGKPAQTPHERRLAAMDKGLQSAIGADPTSTGYAGGKLGAEVAGTAGAGGAVGNMLTRVLPRAAPLAASLASGGFRTAPAGTQAATGAGNALPRVVGGAGAGAASAGLLDKDLAGTGAVIGGALPGVAVAANKLLPMAGNAVAEAVGGMGTRTGGESIRQAAASGFKGGKQGEVFIDNLRGNVPITDVLDAAKANLANMQKAKSAQYRSGMVDVSNDKTVLAFDGIDDAVTKAADVTGFKGQVKNKAADKVRREIEDTINEWKGLNPDEYHTPEGFDALKQRVSGIVEAIPFEEKTARMVGGDIYRAIGGSITKQAPTYSKVMKDYSASSAEIAEIERALSLGNKASVDTAVRKLQSLTRNNVNTNFGNRLDLANTLANKGGNELMPALSGQALNSWTPRGLGSAVGGGLGLGGYAVGGAGLAAPILAVQSPRLMGEAAFAVGKAAKVGNKLTNAIRPGLKAAPVVIASQRKKDK